MIKEDEIFVLEANTIPNDSQCFIPKQVAAINRDLKDILSLVIEDQLN